MHAHPLQQHQSTYMNYAFWSGKKSTVNSWKLPSSSANGWIEVAHYRSCSVSLILASHSFSSTGLPKRVSCCVYALNTQWFICEPPAYTCPAVQLNGLIRAWFTGMRRLFSFASLERMCTFILFIKASLTRGQSVQNNKAMFSSLEL